MAIEKRIQNIFLKLDNYFEKKSFDVLSPQLVQALLVYFAGARQDSERYNLTQERTLCIELENEMRWLMGFINCMNITEVER